MASEENPKKATVAYVPFKTFLSAIETLGHGVPDNINRTVWPSQSGVMISQILGAFRFLGLIQQDGTPTEDLHKLVEDEPNRKALLRKLVARSYTSLAKRDLTKLDLGSFQNAMREYGVTGATLKKAITFFLQLARYAEVPLSAYLQQQTRNVSGTRKRRNTSNRAAQNDDDEESEEIVPIVSLGPSKTINLNKGVTLTFQTSADTFQMAPEDRGFVLKLLDQIEAYEAELKAKKLETDGF
jgi:hypothetical protein